jgi:tetratricopeptide (TPR) repeat protein
MSEDLIVPICPNCGARNAPNTVICLSCGVNMPMFESAQAKLRQHQKEKADAHQKELEESAAQVVSEQKKLVRQQLSIQLRLLLLVAGLVAIVIIAIVALYAYQLRLYRERIASDYERAATCLKNENFLCARDGFVSLLREEPNYRDATQQLVQARLGLAKQYTKSREWESAIAELDAILKTSPKDSQALTLLKDVYDQWYDDAMSHGDLIKALQIMLQRNARFGSGP